MKIVKFKNGRYGIRRGFFGFYQFKDLRNQPYWWRKSNRYIYECQTHDFERVKEIFYILTDIGVPVSKKDEPDIHCKEDDEIGRWEV